MTLFFNSQKVSSFIVPSWFFNCSPVNSIRTSSDPYGTHHQILLPLPGEKEEGEALSISSVLAGTEPGNCELPSPMLRVPISPKNKINWQNWEKGTTGIQGLTVDIYASS